MSIKPLRLPPKDLSRLTLESTTLSASGWVRLHFPGKAMAFSKNPEHRFTPPNAKIRVLYVSRDEETAALEIYGDKLYGRKHGQIDKNDWESRQFSSLTLPPVKVANLTFNAMTAARVDLGALAHRSRNVTHQWGAAVMNHPDAFHGMLFISRFTAKTCAALFQVPGDSAPEVAGAPVTFARHPVALVLEKHFAVALS